MVAVGASAPRPFDKVSVNWTNVFGCCSCFCKLTSQQRLEGRWLSGFPFHAGFWTLCDNWHPERLLLPIMAAGLFTCEMKKHCIFCNWQHASNYTYENKNTQYIHHKPQILWSMKFCTFTKNRKHRQKTQICNINRQSDDSLIRRLGTPSGCQTQETRRKYKRLQIAAAFISNSIYMRGKGQILSAEADTKSKKKQIFLSNSLRSFTKH